MNFIIFSGPRKAVVTSVEEEECWLKFIDVTDQPTGEPAFFLSRDEWEARLGPAVSPSGESQKIAKEKADLLSSSYLSKILLSDEAALSKDVDLVLVISCLASMDGWLGIVQHRLEDVVKGIKKKCGNVDLRIGVVAFRDVGCIDCKQFEHVQLTNNYGTIVSFLNRVEPIGGEDGDNTRSDVVGALEQIKHMKWRQGSTKVAVVLSDTPGHGSAYDPAGTDLSGADRSVTGRQSITLRNVYGGTSRYCGGEDIMPLLVYNQYHIHGLSISSRTDAMYKKLMQDAKKKYVDPDDETREIEASALGSFQSRQLNTETTGTQGRTFVKEVVAACSEAVVYVANGKLHEEHERLEEAKVAIKEMQKRFEKTQAPKYTNKQTLTTERILGKDDDHKPGLCTGKFVDVAESNPYMGQSRKILCSTEQSKLLRVNVHIVENGYDAEAEIVVKLNGRDLDFVAQSNSPKHQWNAFLDSITNDPTGSRITRIFAPSQDAEGTGVFKNFKPERDFLNMKVVKELKSIQDVESHFNFTFSTRTHDGIEVGPIWVSRGEAYVHPARALSLRKPVEENAFFAAESGSKQNEDAVADGGADAGFATLNTSSSTQALQPYAYDQPSDVLNVGGAIYLQSAKGDYLIAQVSGRAKFGRPNSQQPNVLELALHGAAAETHVSVRGYNGCYLTAHEDGDVTFDCNYVSNQSVFKVEPQARGVIALKNVCFGKYIGAQPYGGGVVCSAETVSSSARFVFHDDGIDQRPVSPQSKPAKPPTYFLRLDDSRFAPKHISQDKEPRKQASTVGDAWTIAPVGARILPAKLLHIPRVVTISSKGQALTATGSSKVGLGKNMIDIALVVPNDKASIHKLRRRLLLTVKALTKNIKRVCPCAEFRMAVLPKDAIATDDFSPQFASSAAEIEGQIMALGSGKSAQDAEQVTRGVERLAWPQDNDATSGMKVVVVVTDDSCEKLEEAMNAEQVRVWTIAPNFEKMKKGGSIDTAKKAMKEFACEFSKDTASAVMRSYRAVELQPLKHSASKDVTQQYWELKDDGSILSLDSEYSVVLTASSFDADGSEALGFTGNDCPWLSVQPLHLGAPSKWQRWGLRSFNARPRRAPSPTENTKWRCGGWLGHGLSWPYETDAPFTGKLVVAWSWANGFEKTDEKYAQIAKSFPCLERLAPSAQAASFKAKANGAEGGPAVEVHIRDLAETSAGSQGGPFRYVEPFGVYQWPAIPVFEVQ